MQDGDNDRLGELMEIQRTARAKAAEQNTGLPCDVCGAKQKRIDIQRMPNGGVSVAISYLIAPEKRAAELKALANMLKSFADGL